MTLDDLRGYARIVTEPLAAGAERTGVTPNQLSALSLIFSAAAGLMYYQSPDKPEMLYAAACMLLLNAVSDAADGALARRTGRADPRGDFLDHVIDRYADMFILLGIIFAGYVPWPIGMLAVVGVLLTSYIGTEAQALSLGRYYGGMMGRADRLTLIFLATLACALYPYSIEGLPILGWVVVVTMLSSHITALQRFNHVWKNLP
ncbi:MAG: Bifunctional IPC transferase and DIPP synthase [Methanosaeta sp. PtaB.Bin039]|nr:MAG: Bifunctional IPC transferase and DIPP synthase [Methanosaeta sp. PtaB.Bin039]HOT07514.1 CDP-alcohol phosphatidyltransferase family protein [Methanotrichaceae archaeon]HQF16112.1 CDP-alcohol phosphatidyltransferase family protein [Methanotrichaceae archaeon]HQI90774.1 CDP-alcohol phosphatidyltransferase family protein [Methanotrichaceae archaeon]HQJ28270.1 CDP-alcohol phosphatidyltransferase family protein [Methanotrichaceae archaeon]